MEELDWSSAQQRCKDKHGEDAGLAIIHTLREKQLVSAAIDAAQIGEDLTGLTHLFFMQKGHIPIRKLTISIAIYT